MRSTGVGQNTHDFLAGVFILRLTGLKLFQIGWMMRGGAGIPEFSQNVAGAAAGAAATAAAGVPAATALVFTA